MNCQSVLRKAILGPVFCTMMFGAMLSGCGDSKKVVIVDPNVPQGPAGAVTSDGPSGGSEKVKVQPQ